MCSRGFFRRVLLGCLRCPKLQRWTTRHTARFLSRFVVWHLSKKFKYNYPLPIHNGEGEARYFTLVLLKSLIGRTWVWVPAAANAICYFLRLLLQGLEPRTFRSNDFCSTNWAIMAFSILARIRMARLFFCSSDRMRKIANCPHNKGSYYTRAPLRIWDISSLVFFFLCHIHLWIAVQRGSSVVFSTQAPHCGNSGYPALTVMHSALCETGNYDPREFGIIFHKRSALPHIVDLADTTIPKVKLLFPLKADFKAT